MPGIGLKRNPGVALVWVCDSFQIWPDGRGDFLLTVGEPKRMEFYSHGRKATWEEITASVESGFPLLAEMVKDDAESMKELIACKERFMTAAKQWV